MDHQALMRVLDGGAQFEKQPEPVADREAAVLAVCVDALSLDEFRHQVRHAIGG
jgi:hypothetical protein